MRIDEVLSRRNKLKVFKVEIIQAETREMRGYERTEYYILNNRMKLINVDSLTSIDREYDLNKIVNDMEFELVNYQVG